MPIATLTNLEKTYGDRVLFDKLSLNIEKGERIGLVGPNGAGKSTIFKALIGELPLDAGSASISDSTKLGHLTQDPTFDPANTVLDEAELAFGTLHDLAHRLRDLEHDMAVHTDDALQKTLDRYQIVQHEFDLAGGYVWHHKLESTLQGVGLPRETWEQNVTTLSGGQRSRLALAKILIAEPDLLLLDEPTNHLDLAAIDWLENYLLAFKGSVLLISHDRYLLDRLATRIVWLHQRKLFSYPGNFSAYMVQRELQELSQTRAFTEQQADIEKQKEFIRRFGAGQRSKEAKGREKRLERLLRSDAVVQAVESTKKITLSLDTEQRAGDQVLQVRELSKAYDAKSLWQDIGFHVKRGERIGIIGPNGSGKTTLLETLLGRRDADHGNIRWGANLAIGYYDQRLGDLNESNTVLEEVAEGRALKEQELRDMLATLLFRGDDIYKSVSLLSGGERARVRLAQLLLDKPNVLLLDEPTNHLDIDSAGALEQTLKDFPGTILCVSHDRYFLNKTVSRLLVLNPPGMTDFEGTYSDWQKKVATASAAPAPQPKPKQQQKSSSKPNTPPAIQNSKSKIQNKDNPYLRPFGRLDIKELELQIAETESALADNQQAFADTSRTRDPGHVKRLQAEQKSLAKKLEQLEAEYYARET